MDIAYFLFLKTVVDWIQADTERGGIPVKKTVFKGVATAMVTPMTSTGADYDTFARYQQYKTCAYAADALMGNGNRENLFAQMRSLGVLK